MVEHTVQWSKGAALALDVYALSEQGNRATNQDAVAWHTAAGHFIGVVADGAGGHLGGEVAARLVVDMALTQHATLHEEPKPVALAAWVDHCNQQVLRQQAFNPALRDMHSTVCLLVMNLQRRSAAWVHVGDTRLYRGQGGHVVFRTRDHSVSQWQIDHPGDWPSVGRNILYSALGQPTRDIALQVDECTEPLQPDDWFVLCSDGVWEQVSDEEIAAIVACTSNAEAAVRHLHQVVRTRAEGRADNLTTLLVRLSA